MCASARGHSPPVGDQRGFRWRRREGWRAAGPARLRTASQGCHGPVWRRPPRRDIRLRRRFRVRARGEASTVALRFRGLHQFGNARGQGRRLPARGQGQRRHRHPSCARGGANADALLARQVMNVQTRPRTRAATSCPRTRTTTVSPSKLCARRGQRRRAACSPGVDCSEASEGEGDDLLPGDKGNVGIAVQAVRAVRPAPSRCLAVGRSLLRGAR